MALSSRVYRRGWCPAWMQAAGVVLMAGGSYCLLEGQAEASGPIASSAPKAALTVAIEEPDDGEDPDRLPGSRPGFQLPQTMEPDADYLAEFTKLLNEEQWGKAFRLLTELTEEQMQAIAPVDDPLVFAPVREQVREQVLGLEPNGLRAFRLYFDAQAKEMYKSIQEHPLPGSYEQLELLQKLLNRFYATTIGAEASRLAGDQYFERGLFAKAERCWHMALEHDKTDGSAIAELQARRVLAYTRAGRADKAAGLLSELSARYDNLPISLGGQQVDAVQLLSGLLKDQQVADRQDKPENVAPLVLPEDDNALLWRNEFMSKPHQANMSGSNNNYYKPPQDLKRLVPAVVADDKRVYFAYMGVPFALDRNDGKSLWRNADALVTASKRVNQRMNNNAGDPRNYAIAHSDTTLLVNTPKPTKDSNGFFVLVGYDKATGDQVWSSETSPQWATLSSGDQSRSVSVVGQPLVTTSGAYAVVHRAGMSECHLRKFDPDTGEVKWTLMLGQAEPIVFQYTNVRRMPQPLMLANEELVYVLVGSGMLVTVDTTAGHIKWALQMDLPFGQSRAEAQMRQRNGYSTRVNQFDNPNGSGTLVIKDGVLYAKQHLGDTLYAVDPQGGAVKWQADGLPQDAKFVGIDDERFYMMNKALSAFKIDGDHGMVWKNAVDTGKPKHTGALFAGGKIMVMGNYRLKLIDTKLGDPAGTYRNDDFIGLYGGNLYRFDDLLIAIDQTQIAAFKLASDKDNN